MMESVLALACNTYRQSIRGKILYLSLFFAVALTAISSLFGLVTIGDRIRVIKDFGLMSISLFSVAFIVIAGGSFLYQELHRKTIFNILAKPVSRWEFVIGKFLGLYFTSCVLIFLMGCALSLYVAAFEGSTDFMLLWGYGYAMLEAAIVSAVVILFSTIVVTPVLSGLFAFGIFVAGRAAPSILDLASSAHLEGFPQYVVTAIYYALPQLHEFVVANVIVYGDPISPDRILFAALYTFSYCIACLALGAAAFSRREFN